MKIMTYFGFLVGQHLGRHLYLILFRFSSLSNAQILKTKHLDSQTSYILTLLNRRSKSRQYSVKLTPDDTEFRRKALAFKMEK